MNEEDDLQGDRATPQASDRERRLADALTAAVLEYLEAWGPPDIAFGGQQYCRWGPVIASVGTTGPISGITY